MALYDHWADGGSVDTFLKSGEYGFTSSFTSMGS